MNNPSNQDIGEGGWTIHTTYADALKSTKHSRNQSSASIVTDSRKQSSVSASTNTKKRSTVATKKTVIKKRKETTDNNDDGLDDDVVGRTNNMRNNSTSDIIVINDSDSDLDDEEVIVIVINDSDSDSVVSAVKDPALLLPVLQMTSGDERKNPTLRQHRRTAESMTTVCENSTTTTKKKADVSSSAAATSKAKIKKKQPPSAVDVDESKETATTTMEAVTTATWTCSDCTYDQENGDATSCELCGYMPSGIAILPIVSVVKDPALLLPVLQTKSSQDDEDENPNLFLTESASMPAPSVADYDDNPDVDDDDRHCDDIASSSVSSSVDDDDKDVIYEDIGPGSETYDDIRDQQDPQEQAMNGWTRDVVYNRNDMQERKEQTEYEHVRFSRVKTDADLLLRDGTPLDIDRHYAGAYLISAHPMSHLWKGPRPGYIRDDALHRDMKHGILGSGRLIVTVSASHTGSRAMITTWAFPSVNVVDGVQHLYKNQQEALIDSGGWVALCFIPNNVEGDNRYKQYKNFPRNSPWARALHPVYSETDVQVSASDFVVFNIKDGVPYQLRGALESKWMVPLRTLEQKKATRAEWYYNGGGKESAAVRYFANSTKPRRSPGCTDITLGPNGVLQCRFNTTVSHSHSKKKGDRPTCALHKWAGRTKKVEIVYCEICNVHLCNDCFTTFHTNFDFVTVKNQLLNHGGKERFDVLWMGMFQKLVAYKDIHKNSMVPFRYQEDPKLGRWVFEQRKQYKNEELLPKRIDLLKSIDFEWVLIDSVKRKKTPG